jgi:hypothetical protein
VTQIIHLRAEQGLPSGSATTSAAPAARPRPRTWTGAAIGLQIDALEKGIEPEVDRAADR